MTTRPQNITFKDLHPPYTKMKILRDEEIPQDVKDVVSPIQFVEGEIVDMDSISHYSSCPGKEGKCRKKIDGNRSDCPSCQHKYDGSKFIEDYRATIVLQESDGGIKKVTVFR